MEMTETMFDINIMMVECQSCKKNYLSESSNNTLCKKCKKCTHFNDDGFISCFVIDVTSNNNSNSLNIDSNNFYKNCQIVITYKIISGDGEEFFESESYPLIKSITKSDIRVVKGIKYIYPTNKNLQEHYKIEKVQSCADEYTIVSAIIVNFNEVDLS